MADQRTMAELLCAPTEGYAEAIMVPLILAEQFKFKHSLINMMTSDQFFGLEKDNPHDHIRWFNKITSTIKYKDVPNSAIKLMLFPFSLAGEARRWLEKEPSNSILTWEDLVSKFINEFFPPSRTTNLRNEISKIQQRLDESFHEACDRYKDLLRACPHHGFTELHQLDTFYNALNSTDQDSLNSAAGGNLLERPKLTHAVNQQTSAVTTARTAILKQFPSASVKAVEEICVACGGDHPDPLYPNIPYPSRMLKQKQQEKDEVQIYKFWQMFKQLHINITLTDALILIRKYQKMLKVLLSNKEKLLELANTPVNENFSAVILKKLLEILGDPGKFPISCSFSELKCKALADFGASINLMPFSVWKRLGLTELISTRMTLELANRAICTPTEIARDVFVSVGKFTFPADFVILDYESDPRVPLILVRPFLRTARALINVHGEEIILRDGDERLTLNMRHDTSSYSNQPQKKSINLINVFNDSSEDFLENLFSTNHPSGNSTFSSHPNLNSPEVKDDIFDPEGDNILIEKLLDLDSTKDLHPPYHINPLSGSTTSSSLNHLLEEFADELALFTFPPGNDDLSFDIDNLADLNDNLVDTKPKMFTNKHALDYSSPPLYNEYDDDLFEVESDTEYVYDDPFDSKGEKIKESKPLIDKLDLPSDFLPPFEYDSFLSEDFSEVDAFPLTKNNKDKGEKIKESKPLIDKLDLPSDFLPPSEYDSFLSEDFSEVDAFPLTKNNKDKNEKKLAIYHASSILEDFDPPLYELSCFKEVPRSKILLLFSSENEEKVFKPGIYTSKEVHYFLIPELSHRAINFSKSTKFLRSR
uniref:Reverse transcriptase domain-containing protein n=1 Tax=Tanacetum cinerariifolium TaxID=118510 RepID=A0A6L2JUR0_TANCI|nr:reverse transcriptase domain-containing protein [Tanacetum cinerariifolium]